MIATAADRSLALPDGRRLGYRLYGAADGAPIVLLHGTPGSRLILQVTDQEARRRGLAVIAPDRPGCGLSSPKPGRRLLDWPDDVARLLDELRIERCVLGGISGGGPYAAACGWRLAGRITGLGLIAAMGPLADGPVEIGRGARTAYAGLRAAPWLVSAAFGLFAFGLQYSPRVLPKRFGPAADRAVLARLEVRRVLREDMREAFRQGVAGAVRDIELFLQPWGFALEDIELPVRLWHGEADLIVPVGLARTYAARLPRCEAEFLPGAGHFWMFERVGAILDGLATLQLAGAMAGGRR